MSAHKRFCAACGRPGGPVTSRIWFPPLRLGQSRPGPEWSVCCFNPVGCGCLVRKLGDVPTAEWRAAAGLPPLMPGGESTSARLRHADQELDVVRGSLTELAALYESATAETARVLVERDEARACWSAAERDLTAALAELEQRRAAFRDLVAQAGWIVARDGGRTCLDCDGDIRRGEAYELVPGDDPDLLRHCHCPDRTEGAPA